MFFLMVFLYFDNLKSNDFPTLARSEFVFACMSSNASNRDFMAKCSCAVDEIAKRMSYKEYAQAEAIARLWEGNSPREEAFKSVGLSKERMDKLFRALLQNLNVFNLLSSKTLSRGKFAHKRLALTISYINFYCTTRI